MPTSQHWKCLWNDGSSKGGLYLESAFPPLLPIKAHGTSRNYLPPLSSANFIDNTQRPPQILEGTQKDSRAQIWQCWLPRSTALHNTTLKMIFASEAATSEGSGCNEAGSAQSHYQQCFWSESSDTWGSNSNGDPTKAQTRYKAVLSSTTGRAPSHTEVPNQVLACKWACAVVLETTGQVEPGAAL